MRPKHKEKLPFKRRNHKKVENRYVRVKKQIQRNKESEENLKRLQLGKLKQNFH